MHLNTLSSEHDLLSIFRHLKEHDDTVACIRGFADDWANILAFDRIEQFQLTDISQVSSLYEFVERHQEHLLVGSFDYDLGLKLLEIASKFQSDRPLIELYAYKSYLCEEAGQLYGYNFNQDDLEALSLSQLTELTAPDLSWGEEIELDNYLAGFDTIQDYIRAGDIYQINYTHQLTGTTPTSGKDIFAYYMTHKPVSHAAYIAGSDHEVISLSPEGFIRVDGQKISTQPIKGTRPRGDTNEEDLTLREELITSKKEQAELFMIVDLLRNDLGKVCETGTVRVIDSKIVTAMPNVWHTHATIQGQLKDSFGVIDALLSMFPGGSITGCPKHRAMQIIDELESHSRGIYTGSIGYILPTGEASFNIAIRTMVKAGDAFTLGVGGGITIKSEGKDEYDETLAKAAFFRDSM